MVTYNNGKDPARPRSTSESSTSVPSNPTVAPSPFPLGGVARGMHQIRYMVPPGALAASEFLQEEESNTAPSTPRAAQAHPQATTAMTQTIYTSMFLEQLPHAALSQPHSSGSSQRREGERESRRRERRATGHPPPAAFIIPPPPQFMEAPQRFPPGDSATQLQAATAFFPPAFHLPYGFHPHVVYAAPSSMASLAPTSEQQQGGFTDARIVDLDSEGANSQAKAAGNVQALNQSSHPQVSTVSPSTHSQQFHPQQYSFQPPAQPQYPAATPPATTSTTASTRSETSDIELEELRRQIIELQIERDEFYRQEKEHRQREHKILEKLARGQVFLQRILAEQGLFEPPPPARTSSRFPATTLREGRRDVRRYPYGYWPYEGYDDEEGYGYSPELYLYGNDGESSYEEEEAYYGRDQERESDEGSRRRAGKHRRRRKSWY
ncbi:uncharacterized protein VTP21DRAFT_3737 [Calcarisporiella thermophila]|uniref:uncharacterized protein n=1 Tax=Calcarisporiella thermophila TaxID=911321 RepID=UPI003743713F